MLWHGGSPLIEWRPLPLSARISAPLSKLLPSSLTNIYFSNLPSMLVLDFDAKSHSENLYHALTSIHIVKVRIFWSMSLSRSLIQIEFASDLLHSDCLDLGLIFGCFWSLSGCWKKRISAKYWILVLTNLLFQSCALSCKNIL